jgi:hypothetical protein
MSHKKKTTAYPVKKTDTDQLNKYSQSSYFKDKDKKAIEFLKKHPIPEKLLK